MIYFVFYVWTKNRSNRHRTRDNQGNEQFFIHSSELEREGYDAGQSTHAAPRRDIQ